MPQEFGALLNVDVDLHITAVYESERGEKVDSKAFSAQHIITHQHICVQSVNQMQLAADGCVDFTALFVNTRDVDRYQGKVP